MNKNITKKRALRADLLRSEWKLKRAADFSGRKLRLTRQERQWLDCHEHSHGRREILAVIRGQALLRLAGQTVRISEGEFLVIEPWVRHTSGHLPDGSAVFWWCMLSPGRLSLLLWRRNRIESYQIMKTGDLVRLLDQTLGETTPSAAAELQHWVGALICRFFRTRSDHIPLPAGELHQETVVEKVLAWLDNLRSSNVRWRPRLRWPVTARLISSVCSGNTPASRFMIICSGNVWNGITSSAEKAAFPKKRSPGCWDSIRLPR